MRRTHSTPGEIIGYRKNGAPIRLLAGGAGTLLLTVEETAAELRIARRRVFDLIREGKLPSVLIGSSRRIRSADLAAYVAKLERAGVGAKATV